MKQQPFSIYYEKFRLESERGTRSCLDETSPRFESTVRCAPIRNSLTHHPMPGLTRQSVVNSSFHFPSDSPNLPPAVERAVLQQLGRR